MLADYFATFLYALKLTSLYPSERRATSMEEFILWVRRAWRLEQRLKQRTQNRKKKKQVVIEVADEEATTTTTTTASSSSPLPSIWRPRQRSLTPALWKVASQGLSVFTRSVLYQLLLLAASSLLIARSGDPASLAAHQLLMSLWLLPSILLDSLGTHCPHSPTSPFTPTHPHLPTQSTYPIPPKNK